jgi:hypothetical protein
MGGVELTEQGISEEGACSASMSGRRSRPRWRPRTSSGRSGVPLHGASAEVGRSRRTTLQSRDLGLVACQEKVPEMKSSGW